MNENLQPPNVLRPSHTGQVVVMVLGALAVLVILIFLAASSSQPADDTQILVLSPSGETSELQTTPNPSAQTYIDEDRTTPTSEEALLEKIIENPDKFTGQQVTVTGVVNVVYTDRAFLLDGPGLINDTMLVVTKSTYNPEAFETAADTNKTTVTVSGVVHYFELATVESMLNTTFPAGQLDSFSGGPYILVDEVVVDTGS
jgi:cytoskeletal protein RodZ